MSGVTTHVLRIEGLTQAIARIDNLKGANLKRRVGQALAAPLRRYVVPPMKQIAPSAPGDQRGRYPHKKGTLKNSIGVRQLRTRSGEMVAYKVGPRTSGGSIQTRAWYAGFVVRGTKAHIIRASGLGGYSASIRAANHGTGALALAFNGLVVDAVHVRGAHAQPGFVRAGRKGIPDAKRALIEELTRQ